MLGGQPLVVQRGRQPAGQQRDDGRGQPHVASNSISVYPPIGVACSWQLRFVL